jgi:hypothetical protein
LLNPFKLLDRPRKRDSADKEFAGFQRDPFDAVPIKNEQAEIRKDSQGCYQVRLRLKPKPGIASYLANKLGFHRDLRVDLDQHGSYFWAQVDGHRDLRAIEKKLRKRFSLEPDDSRKATLMFTKMLMLRHLVVLDVGQDPSGDDTQHPDA